MPAMNDSELVSKLLDATDKRKIGWEKTAVGDRFAASYGGKWTLTVDRSTDEQDRTDYYLTITNNEGDEILRILDRADNDLPTLFEKARRHALNVDEALNDLMKEIGEKAQPEISDEDIPF
jgi:hypothetical protein